MIGRESVRRRGFTLIELLVVIAIIAILAAILFPVFANAKERGRQARCCGNLKQLNEAFRQYCDDNNGVMPSSCADRSAPIATYEWTGSKYSASINVDLTRGQIWRWTRNKAIYLCPTDGKMRAAGICYGMNHSSLPAGTVVTDYPYSYSLNSEMGSLYGAGTPASPREKDPSNAFLNNLKLDSESAGRSSKILFLIHEARWNKPLLTGINDGYFQWRDGGDLPSAVHYDGTVCSYVDGHAKWISYEQLKKESDVAHSGNNSQWLANSRRAQLGVL